MKSRFIATSPDLSCIRRFLWTVTGYLSVLWWFLEKWRRFLYLSRWTLSSLSPWATCCLMKECWKVTCMPRNSSSPMVHKRVYSIKRTNRANFAHSSRTSAVFTGKMFPTIGDVHLAPFTDEQLYMEQFTKANFWWAPFYLFTCSSSQMMEFQCQ